ncbi:MAG: hypothetical protein K5886_09955 [Lachnospiraceae bacterium]|nr:hypothetical protein [Lachnospiraceae bacterium]
MDTKNTKELLSDLFDEFEQEKNDLKIRYDDNLNRIDIIESTIEELKRYSDESNMFSPRQVVNDNSVRIEELLKEKAEIEEENVVITEQLKYYSDKSESISSVFADYDKISETDEGSDNGNSETEAAGTVAADTEDVIKAGSAEENIDVNDGDSRQITGRTFDGIILQKNSSGGGDKIIFTMSEMDQLIRRLERIVSIMDSDPVKGKVELGSILYDLKHKS